MRRQTVFVLAGPAGCGKSTFAHKIMRPQLDIMISRDTLRFSFLKEGDDYFAYENQVRVAFGNLIEKWTSRDDYQGVFIDATHLTPKARRQVLYRIKNNPYLIAISIEVPLEIALERNAQRTGRAKVPESAIRNMYNCYQKPTLKEGFDEIWHVDAEGAITKEVRNYE